MAEEFSASHLLELGEFLLEIDEPGARWSELEDARSRACISRSYYATLLRLKERLKAVARYKMPSFGVNARSRRAIADVLDASHELTVLFHRLWSYRIWADYDIGRSFSASLAGDLLDDAARAHQLINDLTRDHLNAIASAIRIESS